MGLTYERADTIGLGWELRVRDAGQIVGRIRQGPDGMYAFYEGPGGYGTSLLESPVLRNADLDTLKEAIEDLG